MSPRVIRAILITQAIIIVLLLGLIYTSVRENETPALNPGQATLFQRSIYDAQEPNTYGDIAELFPINSHNEKLQWHDVDGEKFLRVVSWMRDDVYNDYYAEDQKDKSLATVAQGVQIWVSAVPQLLEFCQSLSVADKHFRIKQYLGLNPDNLYERIVELLVKPSQLFRPCPDPEIDDEVCDLALSEASTVRSKEWPDYFNTMRSSMYGPDGAPWTRLGYTYDWSFGRRNVGASEYILIPGSTYYVDTSYSTEEYCDF